MTPTSIERIRMRMGRPAFAWLAATAISLLMAAPTRAQTGDEDLGSPSRSEEPVAPEDRAQSDDPASSATSSPPSIIEEIVVTGPRDEVLQDAAVSVTTFNMDDLLAQGTTDLTGISKYTPNLEIKTAFAASNPTLFIRGVGLKDYFANASSAVAVWNDGIYMNSPTGQLFQLFDLKSVEVLRGPQGTRYARNATAGAILVEARKPTGEHSANVLMEYGNLDYFTIGGALELPIVDEILSTRFAFRVNQRDGLTKNRCANPSLAQAPGPPNPDNFFCNNLFRSPPFQPIAGVEDRVNDLNNWAGRGLLRFLPTPDMEWILNVHGGLNRSTALQFQKLGSQPEEAFPETTDRNDYFDADLPNRRITQFVRRPTATSPLDGDPYAGDYNRTGDEDVDLFGSILTGTWNIDDFRLTSITGWAQNRRDTQGNEDANPYVLLEIDWLNKAHQLTQDVRVAWDRGEDIVLEAGMWGLMEELDVDNRFHLTRTTALKQVIDQKDDAWAIYGFGTYYLTDAVWLDGGVRYNWDRKKFAIQSLLLGRQVGIGREQEIWRGWTGDLSINYGPLYDITFYLKYSHGFKSGQFNGAAVLSAEFASIEPIEPESTDSFEAGVKSFWWDRRLMINGALFYTRYNDQQVFQLSTSRGALPTPELINANDSVTYGLELETRLHPWEWLEIFNAFGLLESEYLDFVNQLSLADPSDPNGEIKVTVDYSGNRLLNSPRFAWSGFTEAKWPISSWGWLMPRFDWAFKSEVFFDANEGRGTLGEFPERTLGQDDLWILNARLAYRTPDERIEVAGWVRNLTDEAYIVDAFDVSQSFKSLWYVIGTSRFYGMSISFQF